MLVLHLLRVAWATLVGSGLHLPEPYCHGGNRSPERDRGRRPTHAVYQVVDGDLYLGEIILMNLGVHGWSVVRN